MFILCPRLAALLVTFCATTSLLATSSSAQNFDKAEIKTEKLSPTTYMMVGAGGNLGVSIGDDTVFVIDDQYAPMTPKIAAAIKTLTDKPVQFVLNTHWHGDHTGGNEHFGKTGSLIVAHENVRKRLSTDQFIQLFKMQVPASPKLALPVVTITNDVTFHLNGDEIFVFHVPKAHTDGDVIVHFRNSNVIHMGDTFFNGFYPFIDGSSGGTPDGVIAAADRALLLADDRTRIIPGHGPVSTKGELKVYRDMLATVNGRVRAMLREGKKLEDILAARPSAEFDEKWGKAFISPGRFVEMLVIAQTPAIAAAPAAK
jgi:glyoxylase-like metal-dependent hydrolase (beta-lactamase superfamily II)